MAIKVLTVRKFKKNSLEKAYKLLVQLRAAATVRPGYISGQTLIAAEDPYKLLVISTWTNRTRFEEWRTTAKREEFSKKLAAVLETPEHYEIFYVGEKEPEWTEIA